MNNFFCTLVLSLIFLSNLYQPVFAQIAAPKNDHLYVIAHRGAHNGIPENSLAAYKKAIDLGCDFVEIDVRTTKDNEIVSIHNSTIDAYVIGKNGKVRDLNLTELLALDIGEKFSKEWKNTRIPTFEEILKLCKGKIGIYLDLKDADPLALIEIIQKYQMGQNVFWYISASFNKTIMDIKINCPKCIVMPDPGAEQNIDKVAVAYGPKVIASDMEHLSKSYVEKAHKNHAMVFVDDDEDDPAKWEQEWKQIIDWGTDGIQTNQPAALIRYIKNRK